MHQRHIETGVGTRKSPPPHKLPTYLPWKIPPAPSSKEFAVHTLALLACDSVFMTLDNKMSNEVSAFKREKVVRVNK